MAVDRPGDDQNRWGDLRALPNGEAAAPCLELIQDGTGLAAFDQGFCRVDSGGQVGGLTALAL